MGNPPAMAPPRESANSTSEEYAHSITLYGDACKLSSSYPEQISCEDKYKGSTTFLCKTGFSNDKDNHNKYYCTHQIEKILGFTFEGEPYTDVPNVTVDPDRQASGPTNIYAFNKVSSNYNGSAAVIDDDLLSHLQEKAAKCEDAALYWMHDHMSKEGSLLELRRGQPLRLPSRGFEK